ncbi:MAG TPA: 5'-3' exonuclease H3TH domain-containing protein, partial [Motiliproteus sp.]
MSHATTQPPLILVDGSSYLYRAFFASQQADMRTEEGFPTGAIRVVTSMLRSLLKLYPASPVVVVFDAKGKTFRDEIYADYKANRPSMPDDLRLQIEPIHAIVRAMGLPLLAVEGVEADDVIGTLARQASAAGRSTVISTGDKDMAQLVDEHVLLMDTMKNVTTDRATVKEKFGVWPEQVIDYLALVGDTADNIPGVPKCGPKTAAKWLEEYGDLEGVIAHADAIKGKIGENLRASLAQLPMAYELATIKTDVALEQGIDDFTPPAADKEALLALFTEYRFRSWIAELSGESSDAASASEAVAATPSGVPSERNYQVITEQAQLDTWLERLRTAPLFAFDTETTSLDYMQAEIVGVSFAIEPGEAAYVPLAHDYVGAPTQLDRA